MSKPHPHAEADYRVLALDNGSFGVEVSIPDSHPTTVTQFDTQEAAEAWIKVHRNRVQEQAESGRAFRRSGPRGQQKAARQTAAHHANPTAA